MLQFMSNRLLEDYDLSREKKEKSGLFVQDLDLLLNYHWVRDKEVFTHERLRLQLALVLIIAGATSTRPSALMKIKYKDVSFALLPSDDGKRPYFTMKLRLTEMKGQQTPTAFGFYEEIELIHCPVLGMLALAIADGAFEENVQSLGDIYTFKVPPELDRLRLDWKSEWLDRPVFRQMKRQPCEDAHYQYPQGRNALIRLGYSCGYANTLGFYDFRRASGKKLNETVTPEERNHIMGHSGGKSDVYRNYYIPEYVDRDVQAIYFGSTHQSDLIRAIGRIPRNGTAPTRLTDAQKESIKDDPGFIQARNQRQRLTTQIRKLHGTIQKARRKTDVETTRLLKRHDKAKTDANKRRAQLQRDLLQRAIQDHHKSANNEEVQRQLQGIFPKDVLAPPEIDYELPDRQQIATIFSQAAECYDAKRLDLLRVKLVDAMVALCQQRESSHYYRVRRQPPQPQTEPVTKKVVSNGEQAWTCFKIKPPSKDLTCPFCANDAQAGKIKKTKVYARIDSLGGHIFGQHFNEDGCYIEQEESRIAFECPFPVCTTTLYGARDFASHASTMHGSGRFPQSKLPKIATNWAAMVAQF